MRFLPVLLATVVTASAVTMELTFDQESFSPNTTGTFRLTGQFGMNGYGSASTGSTIDYYIFGGTFRGSSTPSLPSDLYFWLESYSATGSVVRGGITHTVVGTEGTRALLFALTSGGYTSEPYPWFQVNVGPSPEPASDPFAGAVVDISGTFSASKSGGAAMSFDDLAGTYQPHEYDAPGDPLTVTAVPEPSVYALLAAAVVGLGARVFRRSR